MAAPVERVLPEKLAGAEVFIPLVVDHVRAVADDPIGPLPFVAVEDSLGCVANGDELGDPGIEPDGPDEVARIVHGAPEVGAETLWRVVQGHRHNAGGAELAVVEFAERWTPADQEAGVAAVEVAQPQGMVVGGEQQRRRLEVLAHLEAVVPFAAPSGLCIVALVLCTGTGDDDDGWMLWLRHVPQLRLLGVNGGLNQGESGVVRPLGGDDR
ncbi:hypothetical protein A2389_01980 [Candidatus Adlerbacteria bacterium RIFOXYB1_FULL_48_10]|nr:MAG: hypothetical protein A2389_01980 [Candidatus Adlerbacteria bacterium RIFOXYB1_FULL_48_10]